MCMIQAILYKVYTALIYILNDYHFDYKLQISVFLYLHKMTKIFHIISLCYRWWLWLKTIVKCRTITDIRKMTLRFYTHKNRINYWLPLAYSICGYYKRLLFVLLGGSVHVLQISSIHAQHHHQCLLLFEYYLYDVCL